MRFKRPFIALAFLVVFLASQQQAAAGLQWCEEDPVFVVNGSVVDITTSFEMRYASKIKGTVHFDLQIPENAVGVAVSLPAWPVPVSASIRRTLPASWSLLAIPVLVTVSMDASGESFPTSTRVLGTGGKVLTYFAGDSKRPMKAKFTMYGVGLL
jgi:hypothetical protein